MKKDRKYFPNAMESMGKIYYVAQRHCKASDANPGTKELPFKTISKAASRVDMYDTVIIGSGTYREEVPILRHGHRFIPESVVTFKAAPQAKVYLKGSDVFEAGWQCLGDGVYKANLPKYLFAKGAYNPYMLSCVMDKPGKARPVKGAKLPETLGQVYVNGEALEQSDSLQAVQKTPGSFVVSADGKDLIVHFTDGRIPKGKLVELTVRERCFAPKIFGTIFIQTTGMVVEYAANPDAFSFCRPLSIRENPGTGITVRKTFHMPSNEVCCTLLSTNISYVGKDKSTLISALGTSKDSGKTWQPNKKKEPTACYFLDEENNILLRHYLHTDCPDLDGAFGARKHRIMLQLSRDEGRTWSKPEHIDSGNYYYRIIKLKDGTLLWPYLEVDGSKPGWFARVGVRLGQWRNDSKSLIWKKGRTIETVPEKSSCGVDEPQACQLNDGRIFMIMRAAAVPPAQGQPGFPSVKFFSISSDAGKSWNEPRPLTYEDGKYVYSPASYPDVIRSSKNGRVYVIMNIIDQPTYGCDPRNVLNIAELDQNTLKIKRNTVAIIENKQEEHHGKVRLSNWMTVEDRYTRNLLLFMKLDMSEYCPIRRGYDLNSYRYEIQFPD